MSSPRVPSVQIATKFQLGYSALSPHPLDPPISFHVHLAVRPSNSGSRDRRHRADRCYVVHFAEYYETPALFSPYAGSDQMDEIRDSSSNN
jgi:hypothetical protein